MIKAIFLFMLSTIFSIFPIINPSIAQNAQPKEKPTIAITTFENLSAYPENAWVAMSFSESLTGKFKNLYERFRLVERVRIYEVIKENGLDPEKTDSLNADKQKEIGKYMGATYLILGSVSLQGSGDDLKTTIMANARMVDVGTGEIKQAESIKGQMEQLFELETQLAFDLLKQMGIEPTLEEEQKLSLRETLSIVANKYYNLGQKAFYQGDYETAKTLYDRALEVVSGEYYQTAELGLIETLEKQKSAADEAKKAKIKEEALRRRAESELKRAEANQRLFAEAKYSMLAEDYETAIERYQQYLDLAKPFQQIKWKHDLAQEKDGVSEIFPYLPLLHGDRIYVASLRKVSEKQMYYIMRSIIPETGEMKWEYKQEYNDESSFPDYVLRSSCITVGDGIVVATSQKTHIVALDMQTGKLLWEYNVMKLPKEAVWEQVYSYYDNWPIPKLLYGLVYIKSGDGMFVALEAKTGKVCWQFDTGVAGLVPPLVKDERIYIQSKVGLTALDAYTGKTLWEEQIPSLPVGWRWMDLYDKKLIEQKILLEPRDKVCEIKHAILRARNDPQFKALFERIIQRCLNNLVLTKEMTVEQAQSMVDEILNSDQLSDVLIQKLISVKYERDSLIAINQKPGIWVSGADYFEAVIGLIDNDIILEVNGMPVQDVDQCIEAISRTNQNLLELKIFRKGAEQVLQIELPKIHLAQPSFMMVIQGDKLYIANPCNKTLYSINAASGGILWQNYHTGSIIGAREIRMDSGCIFISADCSAPYPGYQGTFPRRAWNPIPNPTRAPSIVFSDSGKYLCGFFNCEYPFMADGVLYIAITHFFLSDNYKVTSNGEDIISLSASLPVTGEILWQTPVTEEIDPIYITDTTLYCAGPNSSKLHAFDIKSGKELWQLDIHSGNFIGEKDSLIFCNSRQLLAISPKPKELAPEQEAYVSMLGIGMAQVALGRYESAIQPLKQTLELRPDIPETYWQMMLAYEGLGQWRQFAEFRDQYLQLIPFEEAPSEVKKHLWENTGISWWTKQGYPFPVGDNVFAGSHIFDPKIGVELRKHKDPVDVASDQQAIIATAGHEAYFIEWAAHDDWYASAIGCRSIDTGEIIWRYTRNFGGQNGVWRKKLVIANGQLYAQYRTGVRIDNKDKRNESQWKYTFTLYCFDPLTGKIRWKYAVSTGIIVSNRYTKDFVVTDMVYLCVGGLLYALDPISGTLKWQFSDPDASETSLAVAEGLVCFGTPEKLYALDAKTGDLKWQLPIQGLLTQVPIRISNGHVYAMAYDVTPSIPSTVSYLYAIRADSGEIDWLITFPSWSDYILKGDTIYLRAIRNIYPDFQVPAIFFRSEYVSGEYRNWTMGYMDSLIYALSAETGEIKWQCPFLARCRRFFSGESNLYGVGNRFCALDKVTGVVKWMDDGNWVLDPDKKGFASYQNDLHDIESNGFLYLFNSNGAIYAFDLAQIDKLTASGKRWWSKPEEYVNTILPACITKRPESLFPPETSWLVIGPFTSLMNKGLTTVYPPETEIDFSATYQGKWGEVKWQKAYDGVADGQLDFLSIFPPVPAIISALAYVVIDIISPDDRKVQLRIGSDDGVKVWLNGQVVWTSPSPRTLQIDQDIVPIELKKGRNRLLFKVDQFGGNWGLTARITDENGQPFGDLKYISPDKE